MQKIVLIDCNRLANPTCNRDNINYETLPVTLFSFHTRQ